MSADVESSGAMNRCASCGVKESDDVKLKNCTACYLVKYCGVKCQKSHRPKHKRACKKRAAELRDELLFKQPESSFLGDCPICFLPLPLDPKKSPINTCCSKVICRGCNYANTKREIEGKQVRKCAFCRTPVHKSMEESNKRLRNRAEMNDPLAIRGLGIKRRDVGDYQGAMQYWLKAAKLGDVGSHHELGVMYHSGEGVERDESKMMYHTEQAAIGGHPGARHNLGYFEWINDRHERAVKHWIIGANLGHDESLDRLKMGYKEGFVSKDDLAAALRGHQAAVDATKSPQREDSDVIALLMAQK